jgi:AraC family transcriptional regulator
MTYGVICNSDQAGNWDYICGVEVDDSSNHPTEFSRVTLPKKKYAVFSHRGHISAIRGTWDGIWGQWAPKSEIIRIANAPRFERYSESFDPAGIGGVEIWIPVEG